MPGSPCTFSYRELPITANQQGLTVARACFVDHGRRPHDTSVLSRSDGFRQAPRLLRRGDPQLAAESLDDARVDGERDRSVADLVVAAHQQACRRFRQRVQFHRLACARDCQRVIVVGGGPVRTTGQQRAESVAMNVPRDQGPLVVDPGKQVAAAQRQRLIELIDVDEVIEQLQIGRNAAQPDPAAAGLNRIVGSVAENLAK
jgi:hypothetical protein